MRTIKIKKGLDLPLKGSPKQVITTGNSIRNIGIICSDYNYLKPGLLVNEGDKVQQGQPLFFDKQQPEIKIVSPICGEVTSINRGNKRVIESIIIQKNDESTPLQFDKYTPDELKSLPTEEIKKYLITSGLWSNFKTRPFSKIPTPDSSPSHIFVTAIDTYPLSADPSIILNQDWDDFILGLDILSKLLPETGKIYIAIESQKKFNNPLPQSDKIEFVEFKGPHPAGLTSTHMHHLAPVSLKRINWAIHYQDVLSLSKTMQTGVFYNKKIIALSGELFSNPRLITTLKCARIDEICSSEFSIQQKVRVISGSPIYGRTSELHFGFLGTSHYQVSLLPKLNDRYLFGYLSPGLQKHSVFPIYLSSLINNRYTLFNTSTNGSDRAMVPVGTFDRVFPFLTLPTQLLRSIIVSDIDTAIDLGCLELDEEDMALMTYVCPGKTDYTILLRRLLTIIQKEES